MSQLALQSSRSAEVVGCGAVSVALSQVLRDLRAYAACGGRRSIRVPPKPLTEVAFHHWLADAQPGDALQYHEGHLLLDRAETASQLPAAERQRLHAVANQAWHAAEFGLLHLFSRRIDEGRFVYLAIRSGKPLPEPDFPEPPRASVSASITPVPSQGELA